MYNPSSGRRLPPPERLPDKDRGLKFIIQEHRSASGKTRYYLRLEKDGVFQGWALPKGIPQEWKARHLAMEVGAFPLARADFAGPVRKGKFGPGTVSVWDRGDHRTHLWSADKIIFELTGGRARGPFALVRFVKAGPDCWLLGQTAKPSPPKPPPRVPEADATAAPVGPRMEAAAEKMVPPAAPRLAALPVKKPPVPPRPAAPAEITTPPAGGKKSPPVRPAPRKKRKVRPRRRPVPPTPAIYRTGKKESRTARRRSRPKKNAARWLDRRRYTWEGRMAGWLVFALIAVALFGLIKLIVYLGGILF